MKINRLVGSIVFVTGSSIGAGMLAIPVTTAVDGFFPSTLLFIVSWAFMSISGLLLLESNLKCPHNSNLITIANKALGHYGKVFTWLCYLLLMYSLIAAYVSGLGHLAIVSFNDHFHVNLPTWVGHIIIALFFGIINLMP